MTNQYKAVSEYGRAIFGEDVFDADFAVTEERDHLDGGHLKLVPRKYKVISNNFTSGPAGSEYEAALPVEIERALVAGGHLVRDDAPPAKDDAPPAKKAAAKKE